MGCRPVAVVLILIGKIFLRPNKHISSIADETKLVPVLIRPSQVHSAGQSNTGTDFLQALRFPYLYEFGKSRPYRNPNSGPSSP